MVNHPFVLIHSPLVGTLTWQFVAAYLRGQGREVFTPELMDHEHSNLPYWQQEVESVQLPLTDAILVGHSGAGALLPAIGEKLDASGYIFVDAVLLFETASRLGLMRAENPDFAQDFESYLLAGGQFPNWQDEQLQTLIPDADLRHKLLADLRPRSLDFFAESIVASTDWQTKPCAYLQLSQSYTHYAAQAESRQWPVAHRDTHHFEMLTNPAEIADLLLQISARF
ncbi:MAG: alpha/beta fold hydrolase [Anaerolineae bacterium]|nr:alpha/beta fold hydrolase [Anaerolineae bacterium]